MRTDGTNISKEAIDDFRKFITDDYGDKYLPKLPNSYTGKKAKNAQEAHEAIRPTNISRKPSDIKKYVNAAAVTKSVSPHTFRHSFATHLIDGGANLIEIQQLLGHSDISTTEIYVHLSKAFIDTEYMKAFDKKKN